MSGRAPRGLGVKRMGKGMGEPIKMRVAAARSTGLVTLWAAHQRRQTDRPRLFATAEWHTPARDQRKAGSLNFGRLHR